jgi:hypothetical protein
MDDKQKEKWEKTRKKGKVHFIFIYGVLSWGFLTGFIFWITMSLTIWKTPTFSLDSLMISLSMFSISGIIWGYLYWCTSETKYNSYVKRKYKSRKEFIDSINRS